MRLVENALTKTPVPKPNIAPRLICLTAAGFSDRPSLVNGVLASRECVYGELLNEAESDGGVYGELSSRTTLRGCRNGTDMESPKAMRTGLESKPLDNGRDMAGRRAVRRSMFAGGEDEIRWEGEIRWSGRLLLLGRVKGRLFVKTRSSFFPIQSQASTDVSVCQAALLVGKQWSGRRSAVST